MGSGSPKLLYTTFVHWLENGCKMQKSQGPVCKIFCKSYLRRSFFPIFLFIITIFIFVPFCPVAAFKCLASIVTVAPHLFLPKARQRCKWAFPATHQKLQKIELKLLVPGRKGPLAPLHLSRWQIFLFLYDPEKSCWINEDANLHRMQSWQKVGGG